MLAARPRFETTIAGPAATSTSQLQRFVAGR
jgi:hypothetical protein